MATAEGSPFVLSNETSVRDDIIVDEVSDLMVCKNTFLEWKPAMQLELFRNITEPARTNATSRTISAVIPIAHPASLPYVESEEYYSMGDAELESAFVERATTAARADIEKRSTCLSLAEEKAKTQEWKKGKGKGKKGKSEWVEVRRKMEDGKAKAPDVGGTAERQRRTASTPTVGEAPVSIFVDLQDLLPLKFS
eukprot:GEMP01080325.1.p1 GENE.GEMP01080325.1~~GEMP01080325.1.p1  ORF type:complete len:195 (+),score=45.86 GEMP01080325.1:207-791(+)